jgi:cyclohexadienyl dehydratase
MRRKLSVFVALAAWLVAASAAPTETPTPAPLRVGTSGDYPPFSFIDSDGRRSGFDIEVAERLAAYLGRRVEYVPFQWADLTGELQRGRFDIAMSGVTQRPDRAVAATFTRPYAVTGAVAVIRSADRARFGTAADLDRQQVRIAVNRGGHLEREARRRFPAAQIVPAANLSLANLVKQGEVDAALAEQYEAMGWDPQAFVILGPFTHDRKVYALPRGATSFAGQVNDWLAAREADGWLNERRAHWLGRQAVMTRAQAGFEAVAAVFDLRLGLMPLIAAVKQREHLPTVDPAQRTRVLEHARAAAAAAGLQPEAVADCFRVQIELAEAIQRRAPGASAPDDLSLADLRAAVAAVSDQIIAAIARSQPWLHDPSQRSQLTATMRGGLTVPGLQPGDVGRLTDALQRIHPVAGAAPESPAATPTRARSALGAGVE